jgi:hypothetical protein
VGKEGEIKWLGNGKGGYEVRLEGTEWVIEKKE